MARDGAVEEVLGGSDPILIEIEFSDRSHALDLQSELKLLNDIPSKSLLRCLNAAEIS